MRRKLISLITALALMCVCMIAPCTASAEAIFSGQCGDNLTWSLDSDGTITISGTGDMYSYALGSAPWSEYKDDITTLVVEDGVTSISDYAFCFYDSSYLKTAYIPSSVVSIGDYALGYYFYENDDEGKGYASVSLTIHAEMGSAAFQYAADNFIKFSSTGSQYADDEVLASGTCGDNLTWSVTYGGKLTISGEGKMENSHTYVNTDGETVTSDYPEWHKYGFFVTTAEVGEGITNIAKRAFSGFSLLTSVTIPDSVTDIGDRAFLGCSFSEINIPAGVTYIGVSAFYGCRNLTSIELPAGLEGIEQNAFAYCTGLTEVTIPEGVEYIYEYAFYKCEGLTSVTIPASVQIIYEYAFAECSELETVIIYEGIAYIYDLAFSDCPLISRVYYSGSGEAWDEIHIYSEGNTTLVQADRYYNYSGTASDDDEPDYVYTPIYYVINSVDAGWSDADGAFYTRVDFSSTENSPSMSYLIAAAYDADGNFLTMDICEIDFSEKVTFYLPINPTGNSASGTVKVMIFEDLDDLTPLCDVESVGYSIEL